MNSDSHERRRAQRVDASLNLEVRVPRGDGSELTASLETINISSSGVYFKSDHFIEPMTKLAMVLEVLVPSAGADSHAPVACEGLVVRSNPETEVEGCTNYEIAVFFTRIDPDGSRNLERHIAMLLGNPA